MVVLSASGISKSFGIQQVFRDVSFHVDEGDKIGFLGVNGAGKTTLFQIITGEQEPDSGELYLSRQVEIGYMQQHAAYTSKKTALEEVLNVFDHLRTMKRELDELEAQMAEKSTEAVIHRYHHVLEQFQDQGGLTFESRARSALLGLGLSEDELQLPLDAISGGQRTRVLLAKLLLGQAKLLLLDEPTNHLDLAAISWLEEFLLEYKGTVIVISHDRYFLDRITNKTFELENGRLHTFSGNYTAYAAHKVQEQEALRREYQQKMKEIHRVEGIIAQQKQWNRERNLVTARSKQKYIDRIQETLEKPEEAPKSISFQLQAGCVSGNDVLLTKNLSKCFEGTTLFQNVNLDIKRGEKAFLLGANGCGKTTLFRILLGKLPTDTGFFEVGSRVKIGYYDQAQSDLPLSGTILEAVSSYLPQLDLGVIRNALAAFLFRGDDVYKPISSLSGGERARVELARLMLSKSNFLLLDEPTNHLDIASKEALENALEEYDGTLFVISHDRYFINRLADKIYHLTPAGVELFPGNYAYYQEKFVDRQIKPARKEKTVNAYQVKKQRTSKQNRLSGQLKRLEATISNSEEELERLHNEMAKPEVTADYEKILELNQQATELEEKIETFYAEWEKVAEELEQIQLT